MQNSNLTALAKQLNSMKNPKTIGISIGEVIKTDSEDVLTVSIADGRVHLVKNEELFLTETLKNKTLNKEDKVLVVPMASEQSWVAVDKISEE